jgi:hypothetical protein
MNKLFSVLVFFLLVFVSLSSISAQVNRITNKSSFVGFYRSANAIGIIENGEIQFYGFSGGKWLNYARFSGAYPFRLPNGYTKVFFVGNFIGVVIPNSSGMNTIQFYEPHKEFLAENQWRRVTGADITLPASCIDVVGQNYIAELGGRRTYNISFIDREGIRGYRRSSSITGWESYIIDDEYWDDKLPRGISYLVGDIGVLAPIVNNRIQYYYVTGQGVGKAQFEINLPNGWSDVFAAGDTIGISVNGEIQFYSFSFYHNAERFERIYDRDF